MAKETKTKPVVKKESGSKHAGDNKTRRDSSTVHHRTKKTPDPGPMKGK